MYKNALLLLCSAAVLFSCERERREYTVYRGELFPTTKVFNNRKAEQIISVDDNGTIRFSADSSAAAALSEHDVIVAGVTDKTPRGLVCMVAGIETGGDEIAVHTRPCGIEYAFETLHVEVQRKVSLSAVAEKLARRGTKPGARVYASGPGTMDSGGDSFDITVDYYPFNGDGDTSTPEDQVHVQGKLGGSLYYFFGLDVDWGSIVSWPPDSLPEVKAGFEVHAGIDTRLDAEGVVTNAFQKTETLDTIPLDPFNVWILWFFPEIALNAHVEGSSTGTFSLGLKESGSFDAGASCSSKTGGYLELEPPQFNYDPPEVSVLDSASVSARVGPRLHVRLYTVAGPYATIWASAGIDADQDRSPCWELSGGFDGDIGIDIEVASVNLADWSESFTIIDESLASGDCQDGPAPDPDAVADVTDPSFTPWSVHCTDTVSSFELADSHTRIMQSVDGRYLFSGDGMRTLVKYDRDGTQIWARQYTWDDAVIPEPLRITALADTGDAEMIAAAYDPPIVLKLKASGDVSWSKRLAGTADPGGGFSAIAVDSSGMVYLAGQVRETGADTTDVWIVKTDKDGALVWSRRWGAAGVREVPSDFVLLESDIVLIGRFFDPGRDPSTQSFVVRMNAQGDAVWARSVSAPGMYDDVLLRRGLLSQDGDIIAGGMVRTSQPRELLMKIKTDGTFGWASAARGAYLGPDMTGFVQLSDGGYLSCGTWWTAGIDDIWLARLDSIGRVLWMKRYDDGFDTACPSLYLTGEGGAMLAAYSGAGNDYHSLWLMRVPVKTGDIDFGPASGATATQETASAVTVDIGLADASAASLADVDAAVGAVTVTTKTIAPDSTVLAP